MSYDEYLQRVAAMELRNSSGLSIERPHYARPISVGFGEGAAQPAFTTRAGSGFSCLACIGGGALRFLGPVASRAIGGFGEVEALADGGGVGEAGHGVRGARLVYTRYVGQPVREANYPEPDGDFGPQL